MALRRNSSDLLKKKAWLLYEKNMKDDAYLKVVSLNVTNDLPKPAWLLPQMRKQARKRSMIAQWAWSLNLCCWQNRTFPMDFTAFDVQLFYQDKGLPDALVTLFFTRPRWDCNNVSIQNQRAGYDQGNGTGRATVTFLIMLRCEKRIHRETGKSLCGSHFGRH